MDPGYYWSLRIIYFPDNVKSIIRSYIDGKDCIMRDSIFITEEEADWLRWSEESKHEEDERREYEELCELGIISGEDDFTPFEEEDKESIYSDDSYYDRSMSF